MSSKDNNLTEEAINYMFDLAGHDITYEDVVAMEERLDMIELSVEEGEELPELIDWCDLYTYSAEKQEEFRGWLINQFIKTEGMGKENANEAAGWFILKYGLKVV